MGESSLLCNLRGQDQKGSQPLPSPDPSLHTAGHASLPPGSPPPCHPPLPGSKAPCVSCLTVNVLGACSPVGGKRRGGLVMNEYRAKTTGWRLQREVTMVTKAKSPPRPPAFHPEVCRAPRTGLPPTGSAAELSASRSSERSEDGN